MIVVFVMCSSVNEVVCHGIPDSRKLRSGDIVNLDITVYYNGYHGDLNETFLVGKVSEQDVKLVQCAYESLRNAISTGMHFIVIDDMMYSETGYECEGNWKCHCRCC